MLPNPDDASMDCFLKLTFNPGKWAQFNILEYSSDVGSGPQA